MKHKREQAGENFVRKSKRLLGEAAERADIQCKALKQRKNLALSKDTCAEKEKVQSEVTPKKF